MSPGRGCRAIVTPATLGPRLPEHSLITELAAPQRFSMSSREDHHASVAPEHPPLVAG